MITRSPKVTSLPTLLLPLLPIRIVALFSPIMGGGNGQKPRMAREKRVEKHKPAKGISITIPSLFSCSNVLLFFSRSFSQLVSQLFLSLDLTSGRPRSVYFLIDCVCRQPARVQQESHDHPGRQFLSLLCIASSSSQHNFHPWLHNILLYSIPQKNNN